MRVKLKSITATLLVFLFFAFSLCGCADNPSDKGESMPRLVIGGTMHEPYFYVDENGDFAGIDVDIAEEACRRMGYEPVFKNIEWVHKNDLLDGGEIDCVWTCFSMNGRETEYLWAGPYASDREVVAVLKSSDIYDFDDLNGKTIAVQMTSKAEEIFLANPEKGIPSLKKVFSLHDINESVSALRRGYVDACAGHEATVINVMEDLEIEYRILNESLLISKLGVAFSLNYKGKARDILNGAIGEMLEEGVINDIFAAHGARTSGV